MVNVGQFFMIRFDGIEPSKEVVQLMREKQIGGVILFASNCHDVKQIHYLTQYLKSLSKDFPLVVAIDHEGGKVHRLPKPITHFPPLATLGRLYERMPSSRLAFEVGRAMGRELRALGIDLNFAPVADVHTNPFNPVIGDRAASTNAEVVSLVAGQIIEGMQAMGVAACAKHFPGHGDTDEDSHETLPKLPHNLKRLQTLELLPFQEAIQKKVATIMPAHVVYEGVDKETPATFSVKILRDLLKTELGFEGLIISDDLSMGAIAKQWSYEEACVKAFIAGCDLLLLTGKPDQVLKAIDYFSKAMDAKKIPLEQAQHSFQKITQFKGRFCQKDGVKTPNFGLIGSKDHKELLSKIKYLS